MSLHNPKFSQTQTKTKGPIETAQLNRWKNNKKKPNKPKIHRLWDMRFVLETGKNQKNQSSIEKAQQNHRENQKKTKKPMISQTMGYEIFSRN